MSKDTQEHENAAQSVEEFEDALRKVHTAMHFDTTDGYIAVGAGCFGDNELVLEGIDFDEVRASHGIEKEDLVNNPSHYKDGGIETIDFIEAKKLTYNTGNAVKYISRAGKKSKDTHIQDLEKAEFYIKREIARLRTEEST